MVRTASTMRELGGQAPKFSLPNVDGKAVSLEDFAGKSGLLVIFMCNHCPFVKHILDGFVAFAREFTARGVAVVAISPNDAVSYPQDSPAEMARLAALKAAFARLSGSSS